MNCPKCNQEAILPRIDIYKKTVACADCKINYNYSEEEYIQTLEKFNMTKPPEGAWIKKNNDNSISLGANHSDSNERLFLIFVQFIGITTFIVFIAPLIYLLKEVLEQELNYITAYIVFIIIVLLPTYRVLTLLIETIGKTEITIKDEIGYIFTSIGNIGFKKKFNLRKVQKIQLAIIYPTEDTGYYYYIKNQ